ncbi:MAG: AI-2E family transporter, partial [Ilumatobacteraceae bacterium]
VDPALVPDPDRAGSRALLRVDTGAVLVAPGRRGLLTLAGAVVAGVLAWMLAGHLGAAMVWVVVGGLVAVALSRPLGWLGRRAHLPRPAGAAALFVLISTVAGAATVAGVAGGVDTTTELGEELPTVVTELESLPLIGEWLRDREAAAWVEDQMNDLPQRLQEARDMSSWLPTIGARVLDLFWTVLIAFALLLDGPRLLAAVQRRVPAAKRRQFTRLVDVSQRSIGGYLAGAALVAALNAGVVFTIAIALGIALAPVLAVWAFVWNFVPQIGGFMGGFPLVVLALAAGPLAAVVAGTLFVAYQFVENHLIQPTVIGEAIDVPAWVTLLAALAGGAAAGVVGAVVLTPLVGVVRVILATSRRRDFPGSTVPLGDAA